MDDFRILKGIARLLYYRKDPCCTSKINPFSREFMKREMYTMERLMKSALGGVSGNAHKIWKEFERMGFIRKETETNGKRLYYISIEDIKKFIDLDSEKKVLIFNEIKKKKESLSKNLSKKIEELDKMYRLPERIEELRGLH